MGQANSTLIVAVVEDDSVAHSPGPSALARLDVNLPNVQCLDDHWPVPTCTLYDAAGMCAADVIIATASGR